MKDSSDYKKFHEECKGYDFRTKSGRQIYRWQLFHSGHNTKNIMNGDTFVVPIKRPKPLND